MDDLIKWEPQDNQHLTSEVESVEMRRGKLSENIGRCSLCGNMVLRTARYCDKCGARLKWKEHWE